MLMLYKDKILIRDSDKKIYFINTRKDIRYLELNEYTTLRHLKIKTIA